MILFWLWLGSFLLTIATVGLIWAYLDNSEDRTRRRVVILLMVVCISLILILQSVSFYIAVNR